jgi:OmpA-OmpF porin, OOP family
MRNALKLGGVVLIIVGTTGCLATHKYVQTQEAATNANIKTEDQKMTAKTTELDQRISDVDRHAEQGYSEATAKADAADKHADKADQDAQAAQQTADKGVSTAQQAEQQIDNIDNYQPVKTENVLFGFNRSDLTQDDQQQLADVAQSLASMKHYAIEVEGFTDSTGPKEYNLELSQRRANTVVRYLTEDQHVPLVKIHMLGLGVDEPAADNQTADGRKQNRRVEIRVMTPPAEGQAANTQASASSSQSSQ